MPNQAGDKTSPRISISRRTNQCKVAKREGDVSFKYDAVKNPIDHKDILQAPIVTREDGKAIGTFYLCTPDGGILADWDVQVEDETVKFF